MERKEPSPLKILLTDYAAQLGWLLCLVFGGIWIFEKFLNPGSFSVIWTYMFIGATVIGLALIFWRLRYFAGVFEGGREVEGNVTAVNFFRDRGRITFIYTLNGQRYEASSAIAKNWQTRDLQPGQTMTVVVDPDRPKAAFLRDLYL